MQPTTITTPEQARNTRHVPGTFFLCHDCNQTLPVPETGCGTGYARCTDPDGEHLVCYACTDKRVTADLLTHDKFIAYVSGDGQRLTTWSGGTLGRVYFGQRHPWSRERRYLTARDVYGQEWHGTGAPGMYCNIRKCKPAAR